MSFILADIEKGERKMNTKKAFSILLIPMLIASALVFASPVKAATDSLTIRDTVSHSSDLGFGAGNVAVTGTHFTVECFIDADLSKLYGVDIQIGWDIGWIRYVSHTATMPLEDFAGGILHKPPNLVWVHDDVDETGGLEGAGAASGTKYWVAAASLAPATNFNGTGTAFRMEFVIVNQPGEGFPDAHTQITVTSQTLADVGGSPVDTAVTNCNITIYALLHQLPPSPLLAVEHSDYYGVLNNNFDAKILLMGAGHTSLSPEWDVAGFDFKLTYNATLIEPQTVTVDPDGQFAAFWPGGIFTVKNESDDVTGLAWLVFLGLPNMTTGTHTAPFGQMSIASVTFKAVYEQTPPPFVGPTCGLNIIDVTIAGFPHPERMYPPWSGMDVAVPLPYEVENAVYHAPVLFATGIDIFQYYEIGWGKGVNMPTDMLWPQKSMTVYALVQYNLWPEQQKDVAFEVIDPHGKIWGIFYARTNSTGFTSIFIRLPWPCDDPEYYFGVWTVYATVDIACHVYNDTMLFKYNYRVDIFKTTVDKTDYAHGEYITVTIDYGTVATHTFDVLFTVTATDVTGVPFAFGFAWETVGGAVWCTYANGTVVITLLIPKFARAGYPATVYVGVMGNWPTLGGEAYYPTRYPETIQYFSILPS